MAIKYYILSIFLLCFCFRSEAQKCKTNEIRKANIEKNPNIQHEINRINQFTEKWIFDHNSKSENRAVETVPVVVHVIYRTPQENITDAQIHSQIDVLNDDFRKLNGNFDDTPNPFKSIAADVEIEFCLATIDPNGNPTDGITRTPTFVDNIGETESWYKTANGGKDAWNINEYINIWVCDIGDDGTLGFASPPGTADPIESDGMVIGHQYFGTIGTAANSAPNDLGRTTTHEMGHYFNLEHVWGYDYGGCYEDDFVDDTPLQDYDSEGCPNFPFFDYCTYDGNGIMFNNYMDYTNDDCMTMFTNGQSMRMHAALNGPRSGLLDSGKCAGMTSISEQDLAMLSFELSPNPARNSLMLKLNQTPVHKVLKGQIINIQGQEVHSFTISAQHKLLEVGALNGGVYFIVIEDASQEKVIILD